MGPGSAPTLHAAGRRLWGGWPEAVEAAGLSYQRAPCNGHPKYPTAQSVLDEIKRRDRLSLPLDYSRTRKTGPHRDGALVMTARGFFKNWPAALAAAGIDAAAIYRRGKYPTKISVIDAIRQRVRNGWPIRSKKLRREPHADKTLYAAGRRFFVRWQDACRAAGLSEEQIAYCPYRYPTRESLLKSIEARVKRGWPINPTALSEDDHPDVPMIKAAQRQFGGLVYALAIVALQSPLEDYLDMKPTLERLVLREIKRRREAGLSLVRDALKTGSEEEAALLDMGSRILGGWNNALHQALSSER